MYVVNLLFFVFNKFCIRYLFCILFSVITFNFIHQIITGSCFGLAGVDQNIDLLTSLVFSLFKFFSQYKGLTFWVVLWSWTSSVGYDQWLHLQFLYTPFLLHADTCSLFLQYLLVVIFMQIPTLIYGLHLHIFLQVHAMSIFL